MHSISFSDNLRSVRSETVEVVMKTFFKEHPPLRSSIEDPDVEDKIMIQCEEELTDLFANEKPYIKAKKHQYIEIYGRSHTNSFSKSIRKVDSIASNNSFKFIHVKLQNPSFDYLEQFGVADLKLPEKVSGWMKECADGIRDFKSSGMSRNAVIFVGQLHGDSIIRLFGSLGDSVEHSPVIPTIKCKDDIHSSFFEAAKKQISRHAVIAKRLWKRGVKVFMFMLQ